MPLSTGSRLGPYEVVSPLGAGGMGEVYRARDTRLDRDVAIKVLPVGLLSDEASRSRFRKEAKALSRLSHPHVATLLDFGSADGSDYLVMELVPGPTLDEALQKGPLPPKDVVRLGAQLARGLKAAHDQGVIHRDLKPSNLCLTGDGLLKILDFGLARVVRPASEPAREDTDTDTALGKVVGSPPYMPPEQVLGKEVDARTDIYSAGAVLYELATGRRPFGQRKGAALTDAILHDTPESPRSVNAAVSPGLEAVIVKALDKDPGLRYQTAGELLVDLERLQQGSEATGSGTRGVPSGTGPRVAAQRSRRWVIATVVAISALAGAAWLLRPPLPPRITNIRPLGLNVGPDFAHVTAPTWTTDGVRLYYVVLDEGRWRIRQAPVSGGEPVEVPTPFRSGIEICGFLRKQSALLVLADDGGANGNVWLVPAPRGAPRRVGDLRADSMALSPDEEHLLLVHGSRILLARADGTGARQLLDIPAVGWPRWIRWAPDGKRFRFTGRGPAGPDSESWVWESSAAGETPRPLWPGERGEWTGDGRYFVFDQTNQPALRWDVAAVREGHWLPWFRPYPVRLTAGPVSFDHVGGRPDGRGLLAFGRTRNAELQRYDTRSKRFERFLDGQSVGMVRPSPDGQWLAWVTYPEGVLWRGRRDGRDRLPLTSPPLQAFLPTWSPDGTKVAFIGADSAGDERGSLRLVSANGGAVEVLAKPEQGSQYWDPCFLPDGRTLLFSVLDGTPGIHKIDLETRALSRLDGAAQLFYPKCGPQGQVLASRLVGWRQIFMVYRPQRAAWEDLGPFPLNYPTWTRDGKAFCGLDVEGNRIDCYSFASRRIEARAEIGDMPLLTWVAVPWMGLDADDSPMVMRDRSTRDIYSLDWEAP
jgi:hypothetical protein